jgi:hypothetical protein
VFARNHVYAGVRGWESFEPWLSRVENLGADVLGRIAEEVPPQWYGGNPVELERLMETLLRRRSRVRELIGQFRASSREPFPNWGGVGTVVVPKFEGWSGAAGKLVM